VSGAPKRAVTVLQSVPVWLPLTSTWLCNQIRYLPSTVTSHIVCEEVANLDQFRVPRIHNLVRLPIWRQILDRGVRRLGVRDHLNHVVRTAREVGAEVLHSHWGHKGWQDRGAAKQAAVPHVVSFYGKDVSFLPTVQPRWRGRYRELFAQVSLVFCEGPHLARTLLALGCPEHKVRIHHLGVELDRIPFRPRHWDPNTPLRALIAASFREKKGIPYALEALGRLARRLPDLEITIIGDASADPRSHVEKARIMEALHREDLGRRTRLLGYRPHAEVIREAYEHHVFLAPSVHAVDGDTEGGAPVILIEMAASGMPIVSTEHCDIPSVVLDGVTGLLAPERDAPALASRLEWLIDHRDRWSTMVGAARLHVESEYDVVVQGRRLADHYTSLS
jgi:colanic acid/amylovoran biosynthesis glycosyltransferase